MRTIILSMAVLYICIIPSPSNAETSPECGRDASILYSGISDKKNEKKLRIRVGIIFQKLVGPCYQTFEKEYADLFKELDGIPDDKYTFALSMQRLIKLADPIAELEQEISKRYKDILASNQENSGQLAQLLVNELQASHASVKLINMDKGAPYHLQKAYWVYNSETKRIGTKVNSLPANSIASINLMEYVISKCRIAVETTNPSPTDDCAYHFQEAHDALYVAQKMRALLSAANGKNIRLAKLQILKNNAKWRYYFNSARVLYPWELVSELESIKKNSDNNGFLVAPDYQTFWLHPTAAMAYVPNAPDGSQFEPALILEMYGRNWWEYGDYDLVNDRISHKGSAKGISFIAVYSDIVGVKDIGWGLSAHYNHEFTVSVATHGGDDWSLLFGINIIKLYENSWKPTWDKYAEVTQDPWQHMKNNIRAGIK